MTRLIMVAVLAVMACAPERGGYPAGPHGFEFGSVVPDLTFQTAGEAGVPTTIRLGDYYDPNARQGQLLVLRVGAGWCGTCRWHLEHTDELLSLDVAANLTLVDLVVANDDNVPAGLSDLSDYRARIDRPQTVAIDPELQMAHAMSGPSMLPLFVLIDRKTMKFQNLLNNPNPDLLYSRLHKELEKLDESIAPATLPSTDGVDHFHRNEWDLLRQMTLSTTARPDPTNAKADDPAAAALGKQLFSDTGLSPTGTVACATCHDSTKNFADGLPRSTGAGAATGNRNAPSVLFASHSRWQFWDGRADNLWAQALGPLENPKEFDSSRLYVAHQIYNRYRASYEAIFGAMPNLADAARFPSSGKPSTPAWEAMTLEDRDSVTRVFVNVGKAIAAHERTLRAKQNAFDRYIAGDSTALTFEQKESVHSFFLLGCVECHYGPRFTDDAFHIVRFPTGRSDGLADEGRSDGIAQLMTSEFLGAGEFSDAPDVGRAVDGLVSGDFTLGAFKTPTLRGVVGTAPYGHGGSFATLLDVARNYAGAGLPDDDLSAVGRSEPWLAPFLVGHAQEVVPFLETLTAELE